MLFGIQGIFGMVPFSCSSAQVLTFKDVSIQHNSRYATHDVIGQQPVNEYIGPALTTISFSVQLRSQQNSPPSVYIIMLNEMLESAKSYPLCLGPDYLGRYILNSFTENRLHFSGAGIAIATDVTLQLTLDKRFSLLDTAQK